MTLPESRARAKFWCWHRWKPHYRTVPNVKAHEEAAALSADMSMMVMFGCWSPTFYPIAKSLNYPSGSGLVAVGDRCTKCGKVRR